MAERVQKDGVRSERLRLLGVSFLNAQPILHGLLSGMADADTYLELAPPAELTRRLFEGKADAALAPVAPLATHGDLDVVPGIAIGCDGPVRSVAVVGECPIEEMDEILLDASSRTSVVLTRLIARARRGDREPRYHVLPASEIIKRVGGRTGGLLIGDIALEVEGRFAYSLDLGQAWKGLTGLPFVFAVWVARPGVLTARDCLVLAGSLEAGLSARGMLAKAWSRGHGGEPADHLAYLTENIRYRLDDAALAGLREFLRRAAESHLLPEAQLRFVGDEGQSAVHRRAAVSLDALLARAAEGGRLSLQDALALGARASVHELGLAADTRRRALRPDGQVYCGLEGEVHYSNVCDAGCEFCSFSRPSGHDEGYVLSREQLGARVESALRAGATHVLLQGGLNPRLHLEWYEELFAWLKRSYDVQLHALSPEEVCHLARIEDRDVESVLSRLKAAGLDGLPGGGAEVLTDRVRGRIAPSKIGAERWAEVMRAAHRLALSTTATMMFGTTDTLEDRVLHLLRVRDLQDETGGFSSFLAWDYQPGRARAAGLPPGDNGATQYLRMVALSRLVLDNVGSIQATWVTHGLDLGRVALQYGASDITGCIFEEPFVAASGVKHRGAHVDAEQHGWLRSAPPNSSLRGKA